MTAERAAFKAKSQYRLATIWTLVISADHQNVVLCTSELENRDSLRSLSVDVQMTSSNHKGDCAGGWCGLA